MKYKSVFFFGLLLFGIFAIFSLLPKPKNVSAQTTPKILFGIGTELSTDTQLSLIKDAPVKMLTSWYNGPSDLSFMTGWASTAIPNAYSQGYALHLIVWASTPEVQLTTKYGTACGRAYPLSATFLSDMQQLAQAYKGSGPLYVTLFTEFSTYPCTDSQWVGSENYYNALKDQYTEAKAIFHQYAPNSKVSLGWGGWQGTYDNPSLGAGLSLVPHFADVMQASDFQSFQSMDNSSNVKQIQIMTKTLGKYGPVMLAHYKPDNNTQATFDADTQALLTTSSLTQLISDGLFAWSFMDDTGIKNSATSYQFIKTAITNFGTTSLSLPGSTGSSQPTATQLITTGSANQIPFSLTVFLHGIGTGGDNVKAPGQGNQNPVHQQRTVQITVLSTTNTVVATQTGSVDYNATLGNFTGTVNIPNLATGSYLVKIGSSGYLSKQVPGIILINQGQSVQIPSISLTTGDTNNDNQLDITDYNTLIGCFGTKGATCANKAAADINDDGNVDGSDYNLFLRELSVQKL